MKPVKIQVTKESVLLIHWDNGSDSLINLNKLRSYCPCAICKSELEKKGKDFIPVFLLDQVTVTKIKQVGNYALSIEWKDGHNTGIYDYNYLITLTEVKEN